MLPTRHRRCWQTWQQWRAARPAPAPRGSSAPLPAVQAGNGRWRPRSPTDCMEGERQTFVNERDALGGYRYAHTDSRSCTYRLQRTELAGPVVVPHESYGTRKLTSTQACPGHLHECPVPTLSTRPNASPVVDRECSIVRANLLQGYTSVYAQLQACLARRYSACKRACRLSHSHRATGQNGKRTKGALVTLAHTCSLDAKAVKWRHSSSATWMKQ